MRKFSFRRPSSFAEVAEYLLIITALLLLIGRLFGGSLVQVSNVPPKDTPEKGTVTGPCTGEPIIKGYDYTGGYIDDFACRGNCGTPHYVLYANGIGTQCGLVPPDESCTDKQEDAGLTCIPPGKASLKKK